MPSNDLPGADLLGAVLSIVRGVLGNDEITEEESFLHAGGHSLVAAHLRTRFKEELGSTVRVSEILGSPTITSLAEVVAAGTATATASADAVAVEAAVCHPVSRAQARALFELINAADVPAYQNQVSVRLPARLTQAEIVSALADVVAAYPVLRSTFHRADDGWNCVVGDPWTPVVDLVDLREIPSHLRASAFNERLREHGRVGWDLENGPLAAWRLFRVSDEELVLSQVEHHLIHDGWSLTVLLKGFLAALTGAPVPPEPMPYRAYIAEESRSLPALGATAHFTGRVAAMSGAPADPVAPLPDLARHQQESTAAVADAVEVVLSGTEYSALRQWAAGCGVTSFELVLAAFYATLRDFTGEDDLVIGSAVSARPPGFEGTLGMFVNTVPVRVRWAERFADFLTSVSTSLRAAVDAELIPYDVLLDGVRRAEGSRRNLLYRCMFSAHNARMPDTALPGGGSAFLEYHQNGTTKTPLDVLVLPKQEGADSLAPEGSVRLVWEFDRSLYSVELVRDMTRRFEAGLLALAASVGAGSAADWRWPAVAPLVLAGPPAPGRSRSLDWTGHRSSALAVVSPGGSSTHGDLAALVEADRDTLRVAGVRVGEVVAVDTARDTAYCARVLATMTSGAAVLPVSTAGPVERLRAATATAHWLWGTDNRLVRTAGAGSVPREPATAYVVHTSGSTGTPKRVSVARETLSAYLAAFAEAVELTSKDVLVATCSPLFDASFEELLPILSVGGAVMLGDLSDGIGGLLEQIARQRATVIDLPTALWTVLADELERREEQLPESVRTVVIGGEAYDPHRAARFVRRHAGAVTLLSTYGPAECGISVTFHRISGATSHRALPELGAPIAGATLCVVDQDGRAVPPGRPGVLGIAGTPCRPGLPGTRSVAGVDSPVYLTGDVVRVTHNGAIDYLGRADDEVKIRGYRVAPAEVERVASAVTGVRGAAAVGVADSDGTVKLGLAVTTAPTRTSVDWRARLRLELSRHLPDYMLPEAVLIVGELPLSAHDKIDRAAVRRLLAAHMATSRHSAPAPRGGARGGLRALWATALGADAPLDVDFISAGGDSLSAMRLAGAIESAYEVRVRFRDILRAESCHALDELVGAARQATG